MDTASRADASAADPEAWRYFEPDDYLLGIVQRAVAKEQAVAVGLKGLGEMRILPTRSEYFIDFAPERMLKFCNRPAGEYEVRRLGKLEVDELAAREQPGRNLDEVMWQAAQAASQGKLVKGCRRDDVVLLTHWPNLTRLAVTPNAVRITALLTRYPTTAAVVWRLLRIPEQELNEFYSAAYCAGLTVAVNRKPEIASESDLKAHRHRGLFAQILDRIKGL